MSERKSHGAGGMGFLGLASMAVTMLGAIVLLTAVAFDLGAVFILSGILLAWAGIVKIVVVHMWSRVAGLGTDRHDPVPPT